MNVEPVPVSSLQADLPPELDQIVQRAIAKDPEDRYQSGAELAADIRGFISHEDSFAEATRFFTRVMEQDRPEAKKPGWVLTRRRAVEIAIAVVLIASVFTGVELMRKYREAARLLPPAVALPHAPEIHKTPLEKFLAAFTPKRIHRAVTPIVDTAKIETAKVRVEILHHFASGKASVWLDNKLVLEQELRASTQGRGLFRYVVMNQTSDLEVSSGKHELEVRVVSPGAYDQSEKLQADLTMGPEHVVYVNCDKKKLHISLQ
jgi:hypothetical protein